MQPIFLLPFVVPSLLIGAPIMAQSDAPARDLQSDTWTAVDALGRVLPGHARCGPPRPGKYVGVFYFLWLGPHGKTLFDNTRITAGGAAEPQWGPPGAFHFWGEPYLGYYLSDDEYVIARHAQMLADAGVDAIFFDVTNAHTYDENLAAVCRVFTRIRESGRTTPQLSFLANSSSDRVVRHLHDSFYSKGLYPELWFRWDGKPLILAPEDGLSAELRSFFTIRRSWAWTDPKGWFGDGRDKWPWVDHYPQVAGWHESPDKPEQVAVAVAQHPVSNIGRSFHDGKQPPPGETATEQGLCFAEQWRRALEIDPDFVFITGWNEWVAQRFIAGGGEGFLGRRLEAGETYFVDQYNQEFSRDIEPMRGGHGDNYYYQMIDGIRRFKGVRPTPKPTVPTTILVEGDFEQWLNVGPEYLDDIGDTVHRGSPGWDGAGTYVNAGGRNDLEMAKVARDGGHVYFYIRTREPITQPEGPCWMMLLLDTDGDPHTGWEGFDFVVNRRPVMDGGAVLERSRGGWDWEAVGQVEFRVEGNAMHLAIPRELLGLTAAVKLDFKWADNVPDEGDIMAYIDRGDVAPNGRFRYRYEE